MLIDLDKVCGIVRDLANEHFGDWEQSCKFEDAFRKAAGAVIKESLSPVQNAPEAVVKENLTTGYDAEYLQSKIDAFTEARRKVVQNLKAVLL